MAQQNQLPHSAMNTTMNNASAAAAAVFEAREKDWRNGAVVYQVIVDRFAPSANLQAKQALYPAPKRLRDWSETPKQGTYLESEKLWSHEIDFWGGDLQSTQGKLDYVKSLNVDVLYLNPIHLAYTNHKYDAQDYLAISPEYGTHDDLKALITATHAKGMKVVLDGVFNHMGRNSPKFIEAMNNPQSPYRDWFVFGNAYPGGARGWVGLQNLPELNLENKVVRDHIYAKPESVVQSYLRDGVDGWRLDTAYELGFDYLRELTDAAHAAKPDSLVVGEHVNYPRDWFASIDAVMNFTLRSLILKAVKHELDAMTTMRMITRVMDESGIEPMLKSWLLLDNHDVERVHTSLPIAAERKLAQVMQFTLPGSPNLYYGSELGMTGGIDPEMRAPMRWDWVNDANAELRWTKQLIDLHQQHRALRVGDFRAITANELIAYERYTDKVGDTIIVLLNPHKHAVKETVLIANSKIMDNEPLANVMDAKATPLSSHAGLLDVSLPAQSYLVLKPDTKGYDGYNRYKRIR